MSAVRIVVASLVWCVACSQALPEDPPPDGDLSCGPGTILIGNQCLPSHADAGVPDANAPDGGIADGGVPDADITDGGVPDGAVGADAVLSDAAPRSDGGMPPDADPLGSQATDYAIDPAHDNAQPNDVVHSPLTPTWTATFTGPVSYPLVVSGLAIVAANEAQPNVRALDITTGALVWGPKAFGVPVTLAYDGGLVFALDTNGKLTALDAASGAHEWSIVVPDQIFFDSPPVASGGLVYVNGTESGGTTVAIDEQTGAVRWSDFTFDGSDGCVAVDDDTVYEAEACDQLSAWDAATGSQRWFHSSSCTGGGGAAPAVHDGLVWQRDWALGNIIYDSSGNPVGTFAGNAVPALHGDTAFYLATNTITAVGISTDDLLWSFAGDGQLCTSPVVAGAGGQVFVGSMSGNVYEINEATGKQISVANVGTAVTCATETTSMSLAEGHLLVPAGNTLVVY